MATTDRRGVSVDATDTAIAGSPNPGLAIKAPVLVATTANITLSGLQTIDGVALAAGNRVLVKNQTDATTNGIYNASTGPWKRAVDFAGNDQVAAGIDVAVTAGTTLARQNFRLTSADPITLGSSAVNFAVASLDLPLTGGTMSGPITGSLHIGGAAAASALELRATSGVGAGSEQVNITAGNNGAAAVATFTSDGTFGRFGIRCTPTVTFEMAGIAGDAFVDQYRATMYVHAANGGGSAGLAFGNLGGASIGTAAVIQNVLNRTTGGVTTASALVTTTQDAGNATFAADFAIQTSINATLGTRFYISKTGGIANSAIDAGAGNLSISGKITGAILATGKGSVALANGLNSNIATPANSFVRLTGPSAVFSVGGFSGGADGYELEIYNTVAFAMTIVNEDASSTATNRIKTLTGGNVTLRAGTSVARLKYDSTDGRWILISTN